MANKRFTGILRDPNGDLASNDVYRFTHISTTGEVIRGSTTYEKISLDGSYDFSLEYGTISIVSYSELGRRWIQQGTVTINSDTTATTLPTLLLATIPTTPELVLQLEALLADAEQAANDAQIAASTFIPATEAQAIAGTNNTNFMTSLRTKQSISDNVGSAGFLDTVNSQLDNSSGKVLITGSAGILGNSPTITNANEAPMGVLSTLGSLNHIDAVNAGAPDIGSGDASKVWWNFITSGNSTRATQIATQVFAGAYQDASYTRVKHDSTWSEWEKVIKSKDIKKTDINNLGILVGKMSAGEIVNIACFGDSTTDGNGTSPLTLNSFNTNHNEDAPSAWPARLQSILREIYGNNNISTWNAGYSGRRVDDGWALSNYDNAVTNNPFYGTPDICFIGFGLNDIVSTGSQIDDHVEQTRLLVKKIADYGTLPVLLTTDPEYRNGQYGDVRDSKEARREIDSAKKSIAKEFGIPILDIGIAVKDWIQNNSDGYYWTDEQPDALHFGNNGHAFKAQYVASKLFNDIVLFEGGNKTVSSFSSQTAYIANYSEIYKLANTKQGGVAAFTGGNSPQNENLLTMWVFCTSSSAKLVYRGIDGDGYELGEYTVAPSVTSKEYFDLTSDTKYLISAGDDIPTYKRSDEPFLHSNLKYGLNKVTYMSGDISSESQPFYGYFDVHEVSLGSQSNALSKTGRLSGFYEQGTGVYIETPTENKDLSNVAGCFDGGKIKISFSVSASNQSGFLALHGQSYGSGGGVDAKNGLLIFRVGGAIRIYSSKWSDTNQFQPSYTLLAQGDPLSWDNDNLEGRIEIYKESGQQIIKIFNSFSGGDELISYTGSAESRWAGVVGGLFYNSDEATSNGGIEIKELVINR